MSAEQGQLAADGLPARDSQPYAHEKLHYAGHYMEIFATGMKRKWPTRVYYDLLAGPGRIDIDGVQYAGSPLRSLPAPFTHRIFVESDPSLAAALVQRVGNAGVVVSADCNAPSTIKTLRDATQGNALGLAFVDNLGLNVPFATLQALTENRKIDLMIVFQLQAITRNVRSVLAGDHERESWDDFFGTPAWSDRAETKAKTTSQDALIADDLLSFYLERLAGIGYAHATRGVQVMVNSKNAAQYRLILAGKHERAVDFFKKIERIDYHGQRLLW